MKKLFFIACAGVFMVACNNNQGGADNKGTDSTKAGNSKSGAIVYPYTLEKGYRDWQPGDQQHAVTVMAALKAYENGDIKTCMPSFSDSIQVYLDNFRGKMSNDSLGRLFTNQWAGYKSMRIDMQDWESVISKDGKDEWVTLWYKQVWTDQKGVSDSLAVIDDAKIEKGKIVLLDEKVQHYPKKK